MIDLAAACIAGALCQPPRAVVADHISHDYAELLVQHKQVQALADIVAATPGHIPYIMARERLLRTQAECNALRRYLHVYDRRVCASN